MTLKDGVYYLISSGNDWWNRKSLQGHEPHNCFREIKERLKWNWNSLRQWNEGDERYTFTMERHEPWKLPRRTQRIHNYFTEMKSEKRKLKLKDSDNELREMRGNTRETPKILFLLPHPKFSSQRER